MVSLLSGSGGAGADASEGFHYKYGNENLKGGFKYLCLSFPLLFMKVQ